MNTQPEALQLADWLFDNVQHINHAEAAAELRRLHALNAELLEIAKSVEGMVSNCDVSSGVCCCGDFMDNHPDPMYCGHSPVDSGVYAAKSLLKKARAAIAKAESEKKTPGSCEPRGNPLRRHP